MMFDIEFYTRLLMRRMPVMVMLFLICTGVAIVLAMRLPPMYSTSATLLVEGPQVEVRGGAASETDMTEQLEVIQRRLLTRANLLDVARENRVFDGIDRMSPDEIVEQMRQQTRVRRATGRSQATTMEIGFEGSSPRKVAEVVNRYVNIVMATSTGRRAERTQSSLQFFQQEVEKLDGQLGEIGNRISAFKTENADALPENLAYRLNRQSVLQERLSRAARDLEELEVQRKNLQEILARTGGVLSEGQAPRTPEEQQLGQLRAELRNARVIYSEQNPRVKLLRDRIEALETQIAEQTVALDSSEGSDEGASPQNGARNVGLTEIDSQIATLTREMRATEDELQKQQESIERTPSLSIALDAMERERANLQALYATAIQNLNQAQMNERIELSARGERITVLEPPSVPNEPSSPNRMAIIGTGVLSGLGLAAGFFMLLELLNQSIRRPVDIFNALEVTPLATLPRLETVARRRLRRTLQIASLCLAIVAVPAGLWAIDTYYLPLDLLFERLRDRLI